jgi:hypothetical protein
MISTLGEALDHGWRIHVRCAYGRRDGMKSVRGCVSSIALDLPSVVWTRGRDFPITKLDTRMKCPRCGSRRVTVLLEPPNAPTRQTAPEPHWTKKLAG